MFARMDASRVCDEVGLSKCSPISHHSPVDVNLPRSESANEMEFVLF